MGRVSPGRGMDRPKAAFRVAAKKSRYLNAPSRSRLAATAQAAGQRFPRPAGAIISRPKR